MAEQTQQTANDELETLRRTNAELVTKNSARKAKIAELESANAALQTTIAEREASIRAITIDGPLRQMCESISTAPELFQEQLTKYFKVELIDGKLTLLTTDGKPVSDKSGNIVPFERDAISKFLIDGDDARAKAFKAITISNRASGGSAAPQQSPAVKQERQIVRFGLR